MNEHKHTTRKGNAFGQHLSHTNCI